MSDKDKGPPGGPGQVLAVPLLLFGLGLAAYYEFVHKTAGIMLTQHATQSSLKHCLIVDIFTHIKY